MRNAKIVRIVCCVQIVRNAQSVFYQQIYRVAAINFSVKVILIVYNAIGVQIAINAFTVMVVPIANIVLVRGI